MKFLSRYTSLLQCHTEGIEKAVCALNYGRGRFLGEIKHSLCGNSNKNRAKLPKAWEYFKVQELAHISEFVKLQGVTEYS